MAMSNYRLREIRDRVSVSFLFIFFSCLMYYFVVTRDGLMTFPSLPFPVLGFNSGRYQLKELVSGIPSYSIHRLSDMRPYEKKVLIMVPLQVSDSVGPYIDQLNDLVSQASATYGASDNLVVVGIPDRTFTSDERSKLPELKFPQIPIQSSAEVISFVRLRVKHEIEPWTPFVVDKEGRIRNVFTPFAFREALKAALSIL